MGRILTAILAIIIILLLFYTLGAEDPEGFCTKIKQV